MSDPSLADALRDSLMAAKAKRAPDPATTAFEHWWTSGDPTGPGASLALASPLAANARQAFDAGRAAERQRIVQELRDRAERYRSRAALYDYPSYMSPELEAVADLLDGDGDAW